MYRVLNFLLSCFMVYGVIENRTGDEWTYKPSDDYVCNFVGCCGNDTVPCSPEDWIYINQQTFRRCQSKQQSPINIDLDSHFVPLEFPLVFEEILCDGKIVLRNNTWEIDFLKNNTCSVKTFGNTTWSLLNFHVHNAEHTIDNEYLPLEIHYVHQDNDSHVMVLSLLVSPSTTSLDEPLLHIIETQGHGSTMTDIAPYALITRDPSYWYYKGSLTVPPCQLSDDGEVQWFVFKDVVEVPQKQIYFFTQYLEHIPKSYKGRVNRPLQDILQETVIFSYK